MEAFDHVADTYDATFTETLTGSLQRARVYGFLEKWLALSGTKRVLEVNCGTGQDALWLAEKGCEVWATDISAGMVQVARTKASKSKGQDRVRFAVMDASDMSQLSAEEPFDLIFSNFGGLNCLSPAQLADFGRQAAPLLKDNGQILAVVMGRKCLWETFYFLLKGQWGKALRRRTKGPVMARLSDEASVATWYYSPKEFTQLFAVNFAKKDLLPIGLALPPSYLDPFFRQREKTLSWLNHLEKRLGHWAIWADYADHFLILLNKT